MPSFNQVVLCGHLTRDVELKATTTGKSIANFTLAINRSWKSEGGEKKEEVAFIECTAFTNRADMIAKYVSKGQPLLISGYIRQESWNDKTTGANRSKLKVVVENFTLIGSRNEERPADKPASTADAIKPQDDDETVPF